MFDLKEEKWAVEYRLMKKVEKERNRLLQSMFFSGFIWCSFMFGERIIAFFQNIYFYFSILFPIALVSIVYYVVLRLFRSSSLDF